jgi:putative transferase (TIGR04331 family)
MKKLYLTAIDDKFDFKNDIALGPWCLPTLKGAEDINFIEPYLKDEILLMHRKLFDLTFFLLNRDAEGKEEKLKKAYYLLLQRDYLYFVFFAFSRYRVLKKILQTTPFDEIVFENITRPEEQNTFSLCFSSNETGYLASEILNCLIEKKNIRRFQNINKISKVNKKLILSSTAEVSFLSSVKTKIRKRFNYFCDFNGIYFFQGALLSFLYNIVNMGKREACPVFLYEPKVTFDDETNEFIKIFDNLSNLFINKELINLDFKASAPELIIKYPSFMNSVIEFKTAVNALLENKARFVFSQHGSWYATVKNHLHREIEYGFTSFITWGEKHVSYLSRKNVINYLPSPHLSSIANSYVFKEQKNILWVTGSFYKGGDGLEYLYGTTTLKYIGKKVKFHNCIEEKLKEVIVHKALKQSPEQFYDEMQRILVAKHVTDGIAIELMCDAKIVFIDYPGTPFYEAMSMNVPVILALLESEPFFTEDASAVFQKFEDVGVVYRTPEVAAQFINELYYKDIEQWWNDEKIQSVRREFLDKYANNKPYFWPWAKAILKREI